jgi:hypothetical protein
MTAKKIGGYAFRQEIVRAVNANRLARKHLRQVVDDKPGPQTMAVLVAKIANALSENLDAIQEIERIAKAVKNNG